MMDLAHSPPVFSGLRYEPYVIRNVVYKHVDGSSLHLDAYFDGAHVTTAPRGVVLFLHGNPPGEASLAPKDWGLFRAYATVAAAHGFVGITLNHRLARGSPLAAALTDVRDALHFLRANADRFGLDKDRFCLWAFSAGGRLMGLPFHDDLPFVRSLVGFYPSLGGHKGDLAAPGAISLADVVAQTRRTDVPIFIVRAGADRPSLNQSIHALIEAALARNVPLTFTNHPTGSHAFDMLDAGAPTRQIIDMGFGFIRRTLFPDDSSEWCGTPRPRVVLW